VNAVDAEFLVKVGGWDDFGVRGPVAGSMWLKRGYSS
jgi:hypothetical protein